MGRVLALAAAVLVMSGCSGSDVGAPAVWTVDAGQQVGPETSEFTALVRRLGCNNGVTGELQEPEVRVEEDEVVVTFAVEPGPAEASCPDNDDVPYEVLLPEPLGDRRLVDGQCEPGAEGSGTTHCHPDGVRHRPD